MARADELESTSTPQPEHPRKSELRAIADAFGERDSICPYCRAALVRFPQRKTKCRACAGQIFSRKEPLSEEKRLFKEDELETWEELYQLSLGTWDWWRRVQDRILSAKMQLSEEWGVPIAQISVGDAQWRILNSDAELALSLGNLAGFRNIRVDMIRQLVREEKIDAAKNLAAECIYLAYAGFAFETSVLENEILSRLQQSNPYFADHLKENAKQSQRVYDPELSLYFNIFDNIEEAERSLRRDTKVVEFAQSMPTTIDDVWARFSRDWNAYSQAVATNALRKNS
jgi:hypothetical protein